MELASTQIATLDSLESLRENRRAEYYQLVLETSLLTEAEKTLILKAPFPNDFKFYISIVDVMVPAFPQLTAFSRASLAMACFLTFLFVRSIDPLLDLPDTNQRSEKVFQTLFFFSAARWHFRLQTT